MRIDDNAAFGVEINTGGSKVEAFDVGTAADSDEDYVSFKLNRGIRMELVRGNDERTHCLGVAPFRGLGLQINLPIFLVSRQNPSI